MKVLLFLRSPPPRLGQGRLGWEAAGWNLRPLAGLTKSPGRLAQSPGRVLKSPGRVRLPRPPGRLSEFPCQLLELSSQIRLLQGEPARRWNLTLAMA